MEKKINKYWIIALVVLMSCYFIYNFLLHLNFYPKYKDLNFWQVKSKGNELTYTTNDLRKNINIYKDIENYINDNNIYIINGDWSVSKDWEYIFFYKLSFKDSENKVICSSKSIEKICFLSNWNNVFSILNNLNISSVSKNYLRKDWKVWEKIEYYTEKWYIISLKKDVLKIERRLYDSYRFYEKWWEVDYNKDDVKIDEKGNKVIKIDNEIITIYDDNWIVHDYIDNYNLDYTDK